MLPRLIPPVPDRQPVKFQRVLFQQRDAIGPCAEMESFFPAGGELANMIERHGWKNERFTC
jgi:hypothetical protein